MPKIVFGFWVVFLLFLFGCGTTQENSSSGTEAQDAAAAALASMDRAFAGEPLAMPLGSGQSSAGPVNQQTQTPPLPAGNAGTQVPLNSNRDKPTWVDAPDTVYSRQRFVSAVGFGTDRLYAERNALASLTGVFGQSVQAELRTTSTYNEAIRSGVIQITENSSVQEAITTSIEMDSLMGAEIADVWFDSRNTYYAVAIMERDKSASLYANLIRSNERIISNLVAVSGQERNTLSAYSRYLRAAAIADANRAYANVLTFLGNTSGINTGAMKNGEDYRIEAADIARNIPIIVNVEGDKSGRLRNAFSRSLSSAGFRSGGNDSRYVLNCSIVMTDATVPGQQNVFIRYILDINLMDIVDNSIVFPFSLNGREGHINQAEAEERVFRAAESRIVDEFSNEFRDYLSLYLR
jgi:hypothetical protein